jgi:hypothetical protein
MICGLPYSIACFQRKILGCKSKHIFFISKQDAVFSLFVFVIPNRLALAADNTTDIFFARLKKNAVFRRCFLIRGSCIGNKLIHSSIC